MPAALKRLRIDNVIRTREDAGAPAHWLCQQVVISCTSAPGGNACRGALERYGIGDTKPVATPGTALFDAAFKGATASVRQRLAEGADDWTALTAATARAHAVVVEALLRVGADASIKARDGRTAMEIARGEGHPDLVRALQAAAVPRGRHDVT